MFTAMLTNGNYFFTFIFAVESFAKLAAMSPRYFFAVRENRISLGLLERSKKEALQKNARNHGHFLPRCRASESDVDRRPQKFPSLAWDVVPCARAASIPSLCPACFLLHGCRASERASRERNRVSSMEPREGKGGKGSLGPHGGRTFSMSAGHR